MYGYIYKTTNKLNNKIYIGKHKSSTWDAMYFGSGKIIRYAIKKEGLENFECVLLCECETPWELNQKEKYYIQKYDAINREKGYNLKIGGEGGWDYVNSNRLTGGLPALEKRKRTIKEKIEKDTDGYREARKKTAQKMVATRRANGSYSNVKRSKETIEKATKTLRQTLAKRKASLPSKPKPIRLSREEAHKKGVKTRKLKGSYVNSPEAVTKRLNTMRKRGSYNNWNEEGRRAAQSPEAKAKKKLYYECVKISKELYGNKDHWEEIRFEKYKIPLKRSTKKAKSRENHAYYKNEDL